MAFCEQCGAETAADARFCRTCGEPLSPVAAAPQASPPAASRPRTPLAHLTPRAFEEFTADLYTRLGYDCELLTEGADEGRDVVARKAAECVVIECKHYLAGSVGRPVVQKLHSAMMTVDAPWGVSKRGALVTSGVITREAREYVRAKGLPIELVDLPALLELAHEAGMPVSATEADTTPLHVAAPSEREAGRALLAALDERLFVRPGRARASVEIRSVRVELVGFYRVELRYDQAFQTPSGLDLGRLSGSASVWVGADSGEIVENRDLDRVYDRGPLRDDRADWPVPARPRSAAAEAAVAREIARTARSVSYVGGNNQTYTQVLQLGENDVDVRECTLVFVPVCEARFDLGPRRHDVRYFVTGGAVLPIGPFPERAHLCSRCGRAYRPSPRLGVSGTCRKCGRTVCERCSRSLRSYLIRVDDHCPEHLTKTMRTEALMGNIAILAAVVTLLAMLIT